MDAFNSTTTCSTIIRAFRMTRRIPTSFTTASFINDRYGPYIGYAPEIELTDDSTRHRHGLDKARRMPKLDDDGRAPVQQRQLRRRLDQLRGDGQHHARPDRDRTRISAKGVDRERASLLPLQDGRADAEHLLLPVGALCGAPRSVEQRESRDLLPARPRVRPRHDDGEHEGDARLLLDELQSLPVPSAAHHRVPALRHLRRVVRQHQFPSPRRLVS